MGFFGKLFGKKADAKPDTKPAAKAAAKPAAAPAAKPAPATVAKTGDDRPQCGAVTADGAQCSRRARAGSKYCGLHKGYQPSGAKKTAAAKDTTPTAKAGKDTTPATRAKKGQCAATTGAGARCSRMAREGSKYCGLHKGYRA